MRVRPRHVLLPLLFLLIAGAGAAALTIARLWPESGFDRADLAMEENCRFVDRNGTLLRFLPDAQGERHLFLPAKEIPEIVKEAFIAAEDRRFYSHPGFDPAAIARALADNLRAGRVVSGASTISQQTARLVHPRERSVRAKAVEILRAVRMERVLSKEQILEQYLNRVPLGNNVRGVALASRVYFGKSARNLSPAEAAFLASIAKAPGRLNPYGPHLAELLARKDRVLGRMARCGYLSEEAVREARKRTVSLAPFEFPNGAPHTVDLLLARGVGGPGIHRTTIDASLQSAVERIAASQEARLAGRKVRQAAVIVVRNDTMEVLAATGSLSYGTRDGGYNNGTVAPRSAGSTLKPFLYAVALESGFTASSLLNDTLQVYRAPEGDYSPDNFDRKEYGPVTVRAALANSLNISAVKMVKEISRRRFERFLSEARLLKPHRGFDSEYGLGLAIGNPEIRLENLVAAYGMLANGGEYRPLRYLAGKRSAAAGPRRLLSPEAAFIVGDILSDPSARLLAFGNPRNFDFPFRVSLKTGTSTHYRDGWIVGYTPDYTVGVWTGNFDGAPSEGVSGSFGAAPIFRQIVELLHGEAPPVPPVPPERVQTVRVCGISGMLPGPGCRNTTMEYFIAGTAPDRECSFHEGADELHRLPVSYARWLHKKYLHKAAGRFRLRSLPENLDILFADAAGAAETPFGEAGIRIHGAGPAADGDDRPDPDAQADGGNRRYSIGRLPDGGLDLPAGGSGGIAILYPLPRDRFLHSTALDSQEVRLEALPSDPVPFVDWYVDGKHLTRVGPPYAAYWKPDRGKHRIVAATPGDRADVVEVRVE